MVMVVLGQHLHNATRALAEEMAEHGSAGTLGPDVATWKERRVINEFTVALRLFVRTVRHKDGDARNEDVDDDWREFQIRETPRLEEHGHDEVSSCESELMRL